MSVATFFVPGLSASGGSKRVFVPGRGNAGVTEDCKRSRSWRVTVAAVASVSSAGPLLAGPLAAGWSAWPEDLGAQARRPFWAPGSGAPAPPVG
jgi:hypothetical protein